MSMFDGPEEEMQALAWMRNRLKDEQQSLGSRASDQKDMLRDLLREINERERELKVDSGSSEDDFHGNLWDRFIFSCSGDWPDDQKPTWNPPYQFGEWAFTSAQRLKIGHSEHLDFTYVPRGGGSAKHYYRRRPDEIKWKLTPIIQKGQRFFIGKAKVSEIDAVCSVPQLPAEMDSAETGKRVLDSNRGGDQWQRRVDAKRVMSISNFIGKGDNLIANSAILYAPEHTAVTCEKNGTFTVDFKKFLEKVDSQWCDFKGKKDLRPVWLIDGQHRTRGLAQSEKGIDLDLPIILFPPEFSLGQSAKIFSEINTLQVKLSALHTLYMQHRFGIPSPTAKRDFESPWEEGGRVLNNNSRANHLSYECAAYLSQNKGGPLYNRIKILDSNSSRTTIMQASQWVDYSRSWFSEGGVYGPQCPEDQDTINQEVENYFQALIETCNHGEWKDGKDRWSSTSSRKGLIQSHGPSQALLRIYRNVWAKARRATEESPIPVECFKEVLSPLKWVDWIDPRIKHTFGGSGERPRTALRVWMRTAIEHGESYSYEEVMSETIKSKPGRGALAPCAGGRLTINDGREWPYPGRPLTIVAHQPPNSLPTSTWQVLDSDDVDRTTDQAVVARGGIAEVTLRATDWMKNVDYIDVRVQWQNTRDPPGHSKKRLHRR